MTRRLPTSERRRAARRRRLPPPLVVAVLTALALLLAGAFTLRDRGHASASAGASRPAGCGAVRVTREDLPAWYRDRRATVLVDSVLLGDVPTLRANLRGWRLGVVGHPAIMIKEIDARLRGARVAPLVILGVGYNSLWERNRRRYGIWAAEFDRSARRLLTTLQRDGGRQFVWVTLRHARRSVIPSSSLWQFDKYAWYFPYVNERLKLLDRKRSDLVLARWASVSNKPGLTYDAIHLNPRGQGLMARTVREALEAEAVRQARAAARAAAGCPRPPTRRAGARAAGTS